MSKPLDGQVAIVTGASRGIGRVTAIELARLGASVAVVARTVTAREDLPGTIGRTVAEIEAAGGSALAIQADLLNPDDVERIVPTAVAHFGRLDILVNNAANTGDACFETFWEQTPSTWRESMEMNVTVPWILSRRAAEAMGDSGGLVLNIASGSGVHREAVPAPGEAGWLGAAYPTSKAALSQMTLHLGSELRASGIDVLAFEPGFTLVEAVAIYAETYGVDTALANAPAAVARAIGQVVVSPRRTEWAGRVVWFDHFNPADWV